MKIIHFADLHVRGYQRHNEYRIIINKLLNIIKEEKPDLVTFLGDFWHTKTTTISPESIDLMANIIKDISNLAPLHMILGNHDGPLNNELRQDTITPIG
jgi:DNA repair exonuclease SbcCD nuclease subunit